MACTSKSDEGIRGLLYASEEVLSPNGRKSTLSNPSNEVILVFRFLKNGCLQCEI